MYEQYESQIKNSDTVLKIEQAGLLCGEGSQEQTADKLAEIIYKLWKLKKQKLNMLDSASATKE